MLGNGGLNEVSFLQMVMYLSCRGCAWSNQL